MAIQSNFPAIKPSLLLDFANTKQLDPRITFTRASTATYYDGVTTAMAEQNLILQSQDFSAWTTSEVTTSLNSTAAPDGTTTADTITPSTNVARHVVQQNYSSAGATYVCSIYAKPNGYNRITIRESSTSGNGSTFDVSTGTVVSNQVSGVGSITSVGSGWYRCSMVATETSGTRTMQVLVNSNSGSGYEAAFAGDGTSGVYLWGAQVEQRSAVSAYTATTTQAITNYIPVLQTAASGVARFDNNPTTGESLGLLIEESRTNICLYSSDLSNAAWTKTNATVTADTIVAPDGTLTGDKLVENSTNSFHYIYSAASSVTSGTAYTYTVFAKAGERSYITIQPFGDSRVAIFNLSNGTVATTFGSPTSTSIQSVGNGWYRCSITASTVSTGVNSYIYIAQDASNTSYTGNGFSGIYVWGAQFEAGAFATSYIPTVASTVTRAADAASMTGTNFSSWYNQGAGTIFVDYVGNSANPTANNQGIYHFGPGGYSGTNSNVAIINAAGMTTAINLTGTLSSLNATPRAVTGRLATSYSPTTLSSVVNNNTVATTTIGPALGGITSVNFGTTPSPIPSMNGSIKKFAYYPFAVTSAQLQALTS